MAGSTPVRSNRYHEVMSAIGPIRCTLAAPGVEVVTFRRSGLTIVNGGRLDGERFSTGGDPDAQHESACCLASGRRHRSILHRDDSVNRFAAAD
jgi:hypothetical protein